MLCFPSPCASPDLLSPVLHALIWSFLFILVSIWFSCVSPIILFGSEYVSPVFPCAVLNGNVLCYACSCLPCVPSVGRIKDCVYLKLSHDSSLCAAAKPWQNTRPTYSIFACFLSNFFPCFFSRSFPMDPLARPEYLLLLKQGERSLEDHTRLFLALADLTSYLRLFFDASLNLACRAPVPATINEPAQYRATERRIAPEVEPNPSDQVREPATVTAPRELAVDGESAVCDVKH